MSIPQQEEAVRLLKRFEPILRFTQGELFYPMAVEPYIKECSLWRQRPNQPAERLVEAKELDVHTLVEIAQPDQF